MTENRPSVLKPDHSRIGGGRCSACGTKLRNRSDLPPRREGHQLFGTFTCPRLGCGSVNRRWWEVKRFASDDNLNGQEADNG